MILKLKGGVCGVSSLDVDRRQNQPLIWQGNSLGDESGFEKYLIGFHVSIDQAKAELAIGQRATVQIIFMVEGGDDQRGIILGHSAGEQIAIV